MKATHELRLPRVQVRWARVRVQEVRNTVSLHSQPTAKLWRAEQLKQKVATTVDIGLLSVACLRHLRSHLVPNTVGTLEKQPQTFAQVHKLRPTFPPQIVAKTQPMVRSLRRLTTGTIVPTLRPVDGVRRVLSA